MKSEKGVTLSILILTIMILVILTSIVATNSDEFLEASKVTKLNSDIKVLEDRVATYYVKNNEIPQFGSAMSKSEVSVNIPVLNSNDGDTYYVIDLNKLDNPTLNYGKGYKDTTSSDKYIINYDTHNVYYLQGIQNKGETYYTATN